MKRILSFLFVALAYTKSYAQDGDTVMRYKKTAWLVSTNFNLPTVQFSPYTEAGKVGKTASGEVSFFNSLGAGISLSKADFNLLTAKGDTTGSDIRNHFGFQAGFLFSKSGAGNSRFAFYTGISVLDFQVGIGKEFGDISTNIKPAFYTISYSIPMNKFFKNTTIVLRNKGGKGFGNKLTSIKKAFTI